MAVLPTRPCPRPRRMRRLLGRKAPSVRADSEEWATHPVDVGHDDTVYPSYGEFAHEAPRREREARHASAPFRFGARRERSGTHPPHDASSILFAPDMNLAQWKHAEDAQARRAPPEPAPADTQRQRSASDPDEDPNLYPVYPVPRREHQDESRTRPRDRSSGLFKWKRGGHVLDGALRPLAGGDEEELSEEGLVAREIAGFCHTKARADDWRQVHALGDMIHASESNSKEAVRTLRHEMRGSDTNAQRRAVRAWALWSLSSGGTFGSYACNTQLLSTLEELLENPLTFRELREDILDVLSALTFRVRTIADPVEKLAAAAACRASLGTRTPRRPAGGRRADARGALWREPRAGAGECGAPAPPRGASGDGAPRRSCAAGAPPGSARAPCTAPRDRRAPAPPPRERPCVG